MSEAPHFFRNPRPNKREFDRRKLEAPLSVTLDQGVVIRGWCNDLGVGGLSATVAAALPTGSEVDVQIALPDIPVPLRARAVVRHAHGFRYGFEFRNLGETPRQMINAFVAAGGK